MGQVGPIDAYQANQAAIAVRTDFEHRWAILPKSPLHAPGRTPFAAGLVTLADPKTETHGTWEIAGELEHYVFRPKPGTAAGGRPPQTHYAGEFLGDSELSAYRFRVSDIEPWHVQETQPRSRPPMPLIGPMYWFSTPFVEVLVKTELAGIIPTRHPSRWGGVVMETEVYDRKTPEYWGRTEISYDPSIGFLPRYIRLFHKEADDNAMIKELFIQDARPCKKGGFVPTEWCEVQFFVPNFSTRYPQFTHETRVVPEDKISLAHLVVTRFEDLSGPIALEPDPVDRGVILGGKVVTMSSLPAPVTLATLKTALGRFAKVPKPPALNVNNAEANRYTTSAPTRWNPLLPLLAGLSLVLGVTLVWMRKRRFVGMFLLAGCLGLGGAGCGARPEPIPRISLSFSDPLVVYEPGESSLNVRLKVTNSGGTPLKIFGVDGGCSYRKVDPSRLPLTLGIGKNESLPMVVEDRRQYRPQHLAFQVATDQGPLDAHVTLHAMPRDYVTPDSLVIHAVEGREAGVSEIVHRQVLAASERRQPMTLKASGAFSVQEISSQSGPVDEAPSL